MYVAVTVWQSRVAPLFDTARWLWLYEAQCGTWWQQVQLPVGSPAVKADFLQSRPLALLVCGAISEPYAWALQEAQLPYAAFMRGNADEVVAAYRHGSLENPCWYLPGCGRPRRRHRRRGR